MPIRLAERALPPLVAPEALPVIPSATHAARCDAALAAAGTDWLVVYADREHIANMAYLAGFDPRFEEALLLLGPGGRRALVLGNECMGYAPRAGLAGLETHLAQSLSLMGQDRTRAPSLGRVLRDAGVGGTIGIVGWKYLGPAETEGMARPMAVPAYVLDALPGSEIADATPVLMDPAAGLRSRIDADQIALHEWAAARASAAVWRILEGARPGDTEFACAARMGYAGEPMNAHVMMTSAAATDGPVIGLASPTARKLANGDGVTTAVSYWGGLSSRAGLLATGDGALNDAFEAKARTYFSGLLAWYATVRLGATGSAVHAAVTEALARGGLAPALNPGHLTGHDEWSHTPVTPGSTISLASGMPFQVDIIPVPMADGQALNAEDAVVLADADLRAALAASHPDVAARIEARRRVVADLVGVDLAPEILPLSNRALCVPPFWLRPDRILVTD